MAALQPINTRTPSRRSRRWLGAAALGLLIFGPGAFHLIRLSLIQRRLDRRLADLSARREALVKEQERLQSDPAYVEGLIRSTFKWARPGEYVIPLDSTQQR